MAYREYGSLGALPDETLSSMHLSQRRTFVHRDVIGLVALDFILRIIRAGVMSVSLVIGVSCMDLDDPAADLTGFGVPRHVIANLEFRGHDGLRSVIAISNAMHCDV
jgi:hypothetical protein